MWIQTFLAAGAIVCAGFTIAATDLNSKPPSQPVTPASEKPGSPRCMPQAVQECRAGCDKRKPDSPAAPPAELAKKNLACKQSCIQGC